MRPTDAEDQPTPGVERYPRSFEAGGERVAVDTSTTMPRGSPSIYRAVYRNREVVFEDAVDLPDGTPLLVSAVLPPPCDGPDLCRRVVIAGFGLAGRYVADLVENAQLPYAIIERNPVTVETQRALGRHIVQGDVCDPQALSRAGVDKAAILAITVPDEDAVLRAIPIVRSLSPDIYIIARTNYSSCGMQAAQLGANSVVKAEQAVAIQFYEKLRSRLHEVVVA